METYLTKAKVPYKSVFLDARKNLTVSTLEYADSINADLIVIMTEQEKALSDWFIGTYAQQMLHLSKRPILSMRPEQLGSEAR